MPKSKKYRKKQRGYKRKLANAPNLLQHNRHEPIGIGYDYNRLVNIPIAAGLHYENNRRKDLEGLEALKRVQNRKDHMDRVGIAVDAEKAYLTGVRAAVHQTMGQLVSGLDKEEKKGKKERVSTRSAVFPPPPPPPPPNISGRAKTTRPLPWSELDRATSIIYDDIAPSSIDTEPPASIERQPERPSFNVQSSPASAPSLTPPPASPVTAPRPQMDRIIEDSTVSKALARDVVKTRKDLTEEGFLLERSEDATPKPSAREPEPEPELNFREKKARKRDLKEQRKALKEEQKRKLRPVELPPTTTAVGVDVAPGEVLIKPGAERTSTRLYHVGKKLGKNIVGALKPGGDPSEPAQRVPRAPPGSNWLAPTPTRQQLAEQEHNRRGVAGRRTRPTLHNTPTNGQSISTTTPSFTPSPLPGSGDPYSKGATSNILGNLTYRPPGNLDTPSPQSHVVSEPQQLRQSLFEKLEKLEEKSATTRESDRSVDFDADMKAALKDLGP